MKVLIVGNNKLGKTYLTNLLCNEDINVDYKLTLGCDLNTYLYEETLYKV